MSHAYVQGMTLTIINHSTKEQTMQTIYFTKTFLTGNLKGLSVPGKVSYPTFEQCLKHYGRGKKGKDLFTKDRWIITDASFQNYHRGVNL